MSEIIPVVQAVITDPRVIGATVFLLLYLDFALFVVNYRKKPPAPKKIRAAPAPKPAAPAGDGTKDSKEGKEGGSADDQKAESSGNTKK